MTEYYYPVHSPYRFGSLSTRYNEHTWAAHRDFRRQAASAGWTRIKRNELNDVSFFDNPEFYKWCEENQIVPLNLSYYNELWFECEDDAILFKLTWGLK